MRHFAFLLMLALHVTLPARVSAQEYVVLGWNDLGMHCANRDFSTLAVLPPYNNIYAQVIRAGDATHNPQLVTSNIRVTYEIPGNTYSVEKTNFWDYEDKLFGVSLAANTGLTGAELSGDMQVDGAAFRIEGVPLTPFTDSELVHEDPFQLALLQVYSNDQLVATTQPVVPVSNEINCVSSGCHSSEQDVLSRHENEDGFNPANTPILCAYCHASNALGTTGRGEAPPLSQVIHTQHASRTDDCYKCHPGPVTQCLRGAMFTLHGLVCQDCHGTLATVGQSVGQGRQPWLQEPSCGATACHGDQYAEEPGKLFRQSIGHGGLYCSACQGSPHAILPSGNARDNVQNIALQGNAGTLRDCRVCHGVYPEGIGPHGLLAPVMVQNDTAAPGAFSLLSNCPNPFNPATTISFSLSEGGMVTLTVLNETGQEAAVLIDHQYLQPGVHQAVFNADDRATGVYHIILDVNGTRETLRMTLLK